MQTSAHTISDVFLAIIISAALWVCLLFGGLLLMAFLWSLDDARAAYAAIIAGKGVNWFIIGAIASVYFVYTKMQEHRSAAPPPTAPTEKKGVHGNARHAV